jgi:hypothetical protein
MAGRRDGASAAEQMNTTRARKRNHIYIHVEIRRRYSRIQNIQNWLDQTEIQVIYGKFDRPSNFYILIPFPRNQGNDLGLCLVEEDGRARMK